MTGRVLGLLMLAAPIALGAQQTPPASEVVKSMTPEERAMAQRQLNVAASIFYDGPIDSVKAQLRTVLIIMRDSMVAVEAESARLQRTRSEAVLLASAKRLAVSCGAARRTADITRVKVQPLETSADFGNAILKDYRKSLTDVAATMLACERSLAGASKGGSPTRFHGVAASATKASVGYESVADGLLRTLEIPLRPKGVPGGR